MSVRSFLEKLKDSLASAPVDEIRKLRQGVVYAGKHNPKLLEVAYAKGLTDDPKYFDPDNMQESGAIEVQDAVLLDAVVRLVRPGTIVEVGTWFGTSAAVMSMAHKCTVHTCDRNDVYVGGLDRVLYYHTMSTRLLRQMVHDKVHCQFAFIDANLKSSDPLLLRMVLEHGSPIALHDFERDAKGVRNYQALRRRFKELELVRPEELPGETKCMALMVPRR